MLMLLMRSTRGIYDGNVVVVFALCDFPPIGRYFWFLLSIRAGGVGVNLKTTETAALDGSNENPSNLR